MAYTDDQLKENTMQAQVALYDLHLFGMPITRVNPDGIYDTTTTRAVKDFQRYVGLPITGNIDYLTWDKLINMHFERVINNRNPYSLSPFVYGPIHITKGQKGSGIGMVQTMLSAISTLYENIQPVTVNFIYDDATINQIHTIKQISNLQVNDVLDTKTWNALVSMYNIVALRGK